MSLLSNFLTGGISTLVDSVGGIIDDLHTSKEEEMSAALQDKSMDVSLLRGQQEIAKVEAAHPSRFIAGARPFIIWVCGAGLAYQLIVYQFMEWGWSLLQAYGCIPQTVSPPPAMDIEQLMSLVVSLLGLGAYRTYEKRNGTDTRRIK